MASTGPWQWNQAPDACPAQLEPVPADPAGAQPWCNFTVWQPERLPRGCGTTAATVRREAPPGRPRTDADADAGAGRAPWTEANPSAYRTEIGGGGRRLRLKQFLYDWAFPAADHPCLWGSRTRARPIGAGRVVWLGTDYLGHRACSARMSRTTVELSVLEGEFTEDELVGLYRSLRPAVPEAADRVVRTAFSALSYWARRPVAAVTVPTGLFRFQRGGSAPDGQWVDPDRLDAFLAGQRLPAALGGFAADSAAVFTAGADLREVEASYTSAAADARELRLLVQPADRGRLRFPPQREQHPARQLVTRVAGREVHLAYVDREVGPFDAVWHDPATQVTGRLLTSTGAGLDQQHVLACLDQVLTAAPLTGTEARR